MSVWACFWDLQGERHIAPSGMIRPLPWTAVDAWARMNGYADPHHFEWLWARISGLDRAYLAIEADRLEREIEKARNK